MVARVKALRFERTSRVNIIFTIVVIRKGTPLTRFFIRIVYNHSMFSFQYFVHSLESPRRRFFLLFRSFQCFDVGRTQGREHMDVFSFAICARSAGIFCSLSWNEVCFPWDSKPHLSHVTLTVHYSSFYSEDTSVFHHVPSVIHFTVHGTIFDTRRN